MTDLPIRPGFWNIPMWAEITVYVIGLAAVLFCAWGIFQAVRLWKAGQPKALPQDAKRRWLGLWRDGFMHRRLLKTPAGVMHFGIFWGFVFLFFGTAIATLDWDVGLLMFGQQFLKGNLYLVYKLVLDIAGVLCLAGLIWAFVRRFVWQKKVLERSARFAWVLGSLIFIILTGFAVEGTRLAVQQPEWAVYSPVGLLFAKLFMCMFTDEQLIGIHLVIWLIHGFASLAFVAAIPCTYFAHLFKAPTNLYWRKLEPKGRLEKIEDIEEQERFGVSEFDQFNWKQRLDFDACTECGRCTEVCPAVKVGAPLDPRAMVKQLKDRLHNPSDKALVGEIVDKDALWSCTTCGACTQACPVRIDLPTAIVDMRRHLALEEGDFPAGMANALQNTQTVGNPWGMDPADRLDWAKDLDLPIATEGQHVDYLYWVGCSASYDRRAQKIARAMVKILRAANVSFAVMQEERCHGDFARRAGEEYTFQLAAMENIENLSKYSFKHIVAHCPHCFNTLKNEYPQFEGGAFSVVNHTKLIHELISAGRLKLDAQVSERVVFHDPCYLARYNDIVGTPRKIMDNIKGLKRVESIDRGKTAMCCGAGGGQMWMESNTKRINFVRLGELRKSASTVAVSCPHCLTMFESAMNEDKVLQGMDIVELAELVARAIEDKKEA